MQSEQLSKLCVSTLEDLKGVDIKILDVSTLTDMTDAMVICSGTSNRHTASLANKLVEVVKQNGIKPLGVEGETEGEWVLIDLADIVVHIMLPQTREFYDLESLWAMTEKKRQNET